MVYLVLGRDYLVADEPAFVRDDAVRWVRKAATTAKLAGPQRQEAIGSRAALGIEVSIDCLLACRYSSSMNLRTIASDDFCERPTLILQLLIVLHFHSLLVDDSKAVLVHTSRIPVEHDLHAFSNGLDCLVLL